MRPARICPCLSRALTTELFHPNTFTHYIYNSIHKPSILQTPPYLPLQRRASLPLDTATATQPAPLARHIRPFPLKKHPSPALHRSKRPFPQKKRSPPLRSTPTQPPLAAAKPPQSPRLRAPQKSPCSRPPPKHLCPKPPNTLLSPVQIIRYYKLFKFFPFLFCPNIENHTQPPYLY